MSERIHKAWLLYLPDTNRSADDKLFESGQIITANIGKENPSIQHRRGFTAHQRLICAPMMNSFDFAYGRLCHVEIWGDVDIDEKTTAIAGRHLKMICVIPNAVVDLECRLFAAELAKKMLPEYLQKIRNTSTKDTATTARLMLEVFPSNLRLTAEMYAEACRQLEISQWPDSISYNDIKSKEWFLNFVSEKLENTILASCKPLILRKLYEHQRH